MTKRHALTNNQDRKQRNIGKPSILPSIVFAYVPLLSVLIICQGVPLRHPSAEPVTLPHISSLPLQRSVPPLKTLAVCDPPPPPLSVSLQGLGVHPLLPSAVRTYDTLLW